ncbi:hypothetical protein [Micromonospora globbae]|uniref:hypothetical protein n=1 Tax=Micromonospora globbae TaxID=1894969 RepID=UPI001EFFBDF7|nr:hypothetical protein [Micromonospora globbae]
MTTLAAPGISTTASALRRLYVVRFAFAIVWAGVAFAIAGVAGTSGIPAMLRVWGAWAVVAGLVQLVVGVTRRAMGGQWPMIISGGLSVLAGGSFARPPPRTTRH